VVWFFTRREKRTSWFLPLAAAAVWPTVTLKLPAS
jgi:hypothetical protein